MAISKGKSITDIVARVSVDLSDVEHRRWSSDQIIKFINDGITDLADAWVFQRTDVIVPTASQKVFATLLENAMVSWVSYNNQELIATTERELDEIESGWRRADAGTPRYYIPEKDGFRLHPKPEDAGTALTFAGAGALTETNGAKINGDTYWAANNAGTIVHFKPGDGNITNDESATDNVMVRYRWFPRPSEAADTVPNRFSYALEQYALYRCWNVSEVPEEKLKAGPTYQTWLVLRDGLISSSSDERQSQDKLFAKMTGV